MDSLFSGVIAMIKKLTGISITLAQVCFKHECLGEKSEYYQIFNCPVLFGQKEYSISLYLDDLKTPILLFDQELFSNFLQIANITLKKTIGSENIIDFGKRNSNVKVTAQQNIN